MKTRSHKRSHHSNKKSVKRIYRRRVKESPCRGKSFTECRHKYGCKRTMKGKRPSYCRKTKNRHA